ncbi:MAG: RsmB/NOP family class I SAM-dependent RNA methyltransferase, partial [Clostridia bacterium]|nr:RsmB/NOP family class I SAM-dependent RNA methyltransferase [Clostridia bacterium]
MSGELLPKAFILRMQKQLANEEAYQAFLQSYNRVTLRGIRVNTLKIERAQFEKISPFSLTPVPWEENGFYVAEEKTGRHVYHFAGLYYSQEPSAMSVVPLLAVNPGERVLDLCAAPGGKSTQIAQALQGEGLLVCNEINGNRAKILSQNVERLGVKNAVVTNASPETLAKRFVSYFDKILVDAPCSGEGMFKKNEREAIENWSEENVSLCAARQKEILRSAAAMLRVGGRLVYSTCTFAEAEDEGQIADFLQEHSEFKLIQQKKLYPHEVLGEGHFYAV